MQRALFQFVREFPKYVTVAHQGRAETARPSRLFAFWHLEAASIVPTFIASMLAAAPSDFPSPALALSTMGAPQSDCLVNLQLLN